MFVLMLFMFFFFVGFAAMFYYLLRRLDLQARFLSDEHAQMRVLLRALESRMDKMSTQPGGRPAFAEQPSPRDEFGVSVEDLDPRGGMAGHDSLLHLSFEEPQNPELALRDPALELKLDEPPARRD